MNHLPWSFFPVSGCNQSCSPSSVVWQVPPGQGPARIFAVLEQLLRLVHSCHQTFPGSKLWQQEQSALHVLTVAEGTSRCQTPSGCHCHFLSLPFSHAWRFMDIFYPTNALSCQKQPREWARLIISSSASFLCCWWSAPNLGEDRLFLSEGQCVASRWDRYGEVLWINNNM